MTVVDFCLRPEISPHFVFASPRLCISQKSPRFMNTRIVNYCSGRQSFGAEGVEVRVEALRLFLFTNMTVHFAVAFDDGERVNASRKSVVYTVVSLFEGSRSNATL